MTPTDLQDARRERDKTQAEMAEFLGCAVSSYQKWEGGFRKIPAWVSQRLKIPDIMEIKGLTLEEVLRLDAISKAEKISMEELIGRLIRKGLESDDR